MLVVRVGYDFSVTWSFRIRTMGLNGTISGHVESRKENRGLLK